MRRYGSVYDGRPSATAETDAVDRSLEQWRVSTAAILAGSVALLNVTSAVVTLMMQ